MRKIIYIDMDAFYASVGQPDHPELRGIPIAVGGAEPQRWLLRVCYNKVESPLRRTLPLPYTG